MFSYKKTHLVHLKINDFFKSLILSLLVYFGISHQASAQKCATEELHNYNQQKNPSFESTESFELWMNTMRRFRKELTSQRISATILQIPVVVHVIHNGEPEGSGINIPYEQILSQITVLNEDFRRTNPDKADTPAEFLPVAADTEIEFVLAKQDPDGLPTNGINRVKGDKSFWLWTEQSWLKQQSYWPAEDYLNIWVCDIGSESGQNILGYATYPVSGLEGLNFATNNRLTDGVVVDYKVFGSSVLFPAGNYTANYDRGRTLTHELGHFFGLRHIWGDASDCIASDYCVDTPSQDVSTTGCPGSKSSCSVSNMISNYMDYTYDACMNIFTLDQTDRMRTVLSFSPRRLSLTTSHGLVAPTTYSNDLAITSINQPGGSVCISSIIPEITISNIGNNDISSASVNIFKDGLFIESKSISSTLAVSGATVLQFSPLSLTPGTRHLIQFEIQSVNGGTDPNPLKNVDSVSLVVPVQAAIPVYETMEIYPSSWIIEDYDQSISWTQVFAPNGNVGNKAMMMDFYNYEIIGETDAFISPAINLQNTSTAFLSFDVAYAPYPGSFSDGLIVGVLSDCNMTMASMDTIYYKSGDILATTAGITYSYKPQSITDWRNESFIDLSAHIGKANVQIVFLGINGYGNNLYIDNIYLTTDKTEDITITEVLNPPKYSCSPASEMKIEIKNNGIDPLQSFDFHYSLDGSVTISQSYSGLNILPGEFYTILINPMDYSTGNHSLSILFDVPNGKNDMAPFDNAVDWNFKVSDYSEIIPHRQDFENTGNAEWYWDPNWKYSTFQSGTVLKLPAYNAGQKGKTSWLVSPTFDFSTIEKASLFFDVAYSSGLSSFETLKVLLSTDCGNTYPHLLYEKSGDLLASASYEANFTPDFLSDWRNEYINLSNFVGETEVKIAFMVSHNDGNNLYLDNIELFIDDNPNPLSFDEKVSQAYPNPAIYGLFKLTFNLNQKEKVKIIALNALGQTIKTIHSSYVLNQTVEIDLSNEGAGIYLLLIEGESFSTTRKVFISDY